MRKAIVVLHDLGDKSSFKFAQIDSASGQMNFRAEALFEKAFFRPETR
jgi:hypothetical protein